MKEKCGDCKDYRLVDGSQFGNCKAWQACWFGIDVDPDKTPLENLKDQSRLAYLLARGIKFFIDSACFRSKEVPKNVFW